MSRVQVLDEAVCVVLRANVLVKARIFLFYLYESIEG